MFDETFVLDESIVREVISIFLKNKKSLVSRFGHKFYASCLKDLGVLLACSVKLISPEAKTLPEA